MKPYKYFYSKQQDELIKEFPIPDLDGNPEKAHVNEVFVNGHFIRYTEKKEHGDSNFDDAIFLGIYPQWWIRHNGAVQCKALAKYLINNAIN